MTRPPATPLPPRAARRWAFGILLFEMLTGAPPFDDSNALGIYKQIIANRLVYPVTIKGLGKALVANLLVSQPHKRLGGGKSGAQEVMDDPFFAEFNFEALGRKEYEPPLLPANAGLAEDYPQGEQSSGAASSLFVDSSAPVSALEIVRLDGEFSTL